LIAAAYCQTNCVADGTYCQKCTTSVPYCNGVSQAGSCIAATNSFPSGSPCSGVASGDNVCTPNGDLSTYTSDALNFVINASKAAYTTCTGNSNYQSSCCPSACTDASSCNFCPKKCSSSGSTNKDVTGKTVTNGTKPCYSECTNCPSKGGAGFTTSFCDNNCGSKGTGSFACSGDSACCNTGAASVLSSWLF